MEPRRYLPKGCILYIKRVPPETTAEDIVEIFDRARIHLTADCVEVRQHSHGWSANISLPHHEVARILGLHFWRGGITFKGHVYQDFPVQIVPLATKALERDTANAWPPVVERRTNE